MGTNGSKSAAPKPVVQQPPPPPKLPTFQINSNSNINRFIIANHLGVDRNNANQHRLLLSTLRPTPAPQPLAQAKSIHIENYNLNSYDLFSNCVNSYKNLDDSKRILFANRIKENTAKQIEFEKSAHELKLAKIRERDAELARQSVLSKPRSSIDSIFANIGRLNFIKKIDADTFYPKPKRPVLTPEILKTVSWASQPQPYTQALIELDGVQILRKDIQTLTGLNWLNDEIINAYMFLIVTRGKSTDYKSVYTFNTFFYPKVRDSGHGSVKRWTRKVNIFSYDFLLVPVHLGNHWCLAVIDFTKKSISYFDSLGGSSSTCTRVLLDYLKAESSDKLKQDFDTENWKCIDKYRDGIPKQENGSDCGVFACTYAEYATRLAKLDFTQKDMPYFRKKMIYEIVKGQII